MKAQGSCRKLLSCGLIVTLILLGACGGSSGTRSASLCPDRQLPQGYVIGPGDVLSIIVWRNDELSIETPVRPDGKISTPLVDDQQASGETPSELARAMETALGEYLRSPKVSVIVVSQGSSNQIQVIGEVLNPQSISYRDDLRILDVIVAVGGLTEFAAGNRTKIIRQIDDGQIECLVRAKDLLNGSLRENIHVFPRDVVIVPETRF